MYHDLREDVKDAIRNSISRCLSKEEKCVLFPNAMSCDTLGREFKKMYRERRIVIEDNQGFALRDIDVIDAVNRASQILFSLIKVLTILEL